MSQVFYVKYHRLRMRAPSRTECFTTTTAARRAAQEKVNPHVKHGYFLEWASPSPPWPHQKIKTILKRDTGVIGLCAPFIKYYYNVSAFIMHIRPTCPLRLGHPGVPIIGWHLRQGLGCLVPGLPCRHAGAPTLP